MFLLQAKTLFVEAAKTVFDQAYPNSLMRGIWVGMEYPADKENYPGIWVDFVPSALQVAGLGHHEMLDNGDGTYRKTTRWRFGGTVTFTLSALSSVQRDAMADEMIRVIAFSGESAVLGRFRKMLEVNDLMDLSMQWDTMSLTGKDESQGTPWNTPEIIYEITVAMDLQGSFVSDSASDNALVPLSAIVIKDQGPGEPDPTFVTTPPVNGVDPGGWM